MILGWERFSRAISEAELSSGGAAGGFRAGRVTGSGLRLTQELKISETLLNNEGAALALQPCHLICGVARCCGVLLPLDEEHRISCAPGGLFFQRQGALLVQQVHQILPLPAAMPLKPHRGYGQSEQEPLCSHQETARGRRASPKIRGSDASGEGGSFLGRKTFLPSSLSPQESGALCQDPNVTFARQIRARSAGQETFESQIWPRRVVASQLSSSPSWDFCLTRRMPFFFSFFLSNALFFLFSAG